MSVGWSIMIQIMPECVSSGCDLGNCDTVNGGIGAQFWEFARWLGVFRLIIYVTYIFTQSAHIWIAVSGKEWFLLV